MLPMSETGTNQGLLSRISGQAVYEDMRKPLSEWHFRMEATLSKQRRRTLGPRFVPVSW
jgi:hypothetical protein